LIGKGFLIYAIKIGTSHLRILQRHLERLALWPQVGLPRRWRANHGCSSCRNLIIFRFRQDTTALLGLFRLLHFRAYLLEYFIGIRPSHPASKTAGVFTLQWFIANLRDHRYGTAQCLQATFGSIHAVVRDDRVDNELKHRDAVSY